MKIVLREDTDPDVEEYYRLQFRVYHEPYLLWDRDFWEMVFSTCSVFRIEADGRYAGDIILQDRGKGAIYLVDFSLLPDYQGQRIGKAVIEQMKKIAGKLTAITRHETLPFFLRCGFGIKRTIRHYYHPGVDGYYITCGQDNQG